MRYPDESIDDYVERRVTEALGRVEIASLQQLPLAAMRRYFEQQYDQLVQERESTDNITVVTALPEGAYDGQEIMYLAASSPRIKWHLKFDDEDDYWYYVGGPPLHEEQGGSGTTTSATYASLTGTAGPSLTLPLAGDYMIGLGAMVKNSAAGQECFMSYDIGTTAAADADRLDFANIGTSNKSMSLFRSDEKTGLTAVTLTTKFRVGGGTGTWENAYIQATPIRVQ